MICLSCVGFQSNCVNSADVESRSSNNLCSGRYLFAMASTIRGKWTEAHAGSNVRVIVILHLLVVGHSSIEDPKLFTANPFLPVSLPLARIRRKTKRDLSITPIIHVRVSLVKFSLFIRSDNGRVPFLQFITMPQFSDDYSIAKTCKHLKLDMLI